MRGAGEGCGVCFGAEMTVVWVGMTAEVRSEQEYRNITTRLKPQAPDDTTETEAEQ